MRPPETPRPAAMVAVVARLIAYPAAPPNWLAPTLLRGAVPFLREMLRFENTYPGRKELRDRFVRVRDAAWLVRNALKDPVLLPLLEAERLTAGGADRLERFVAFLDQRLLPAASRAEQCIRPGRGRDGHVANPQGLSLRGICAAWVAAAWHEVQARPTPHTSARVHQACEALWFASGGDRRGWGNSLSGWRSELKATKAPAHARAVEIVRNDMRTWRDTLQINGRKNG